jgi:hypothetical protein
MSENSKDMKTRDSTVGKRWLRIAREYRMVEKGEIVQAELDRILDSPLWEEMDDEDKETILKIVLKEDPEATLDEIE